MSLDPRSYAAHPAISGCSCRWRMSGDGFWQHVWRDPACPEHGDSAATPQGGGA